MRGLGCKVRSTVTISAFPLSGQRRSIDVALDVVRDPGRWWTGL